MKRLFKIILTLLLILTGLCFVRLEPSREVYGHFACDCAEGSCSRMFEITTRTIHVDTTTFCNKRKPGEKFIMQSQLQTDIKQDGKSDGYKLTVPLIMLLDPRNVFGCPDCLDQGGSYFEFTLLGLTRHFEVERGNEPIYFSSLTEQIASKFVDVNNRVTTNSR